MTQRRVTILGAVRAPVKSRHSTVSFILKGMPRKYELKRRAERQEETRRRIVEAAVELHGTIGPARTTVSAIADRAGVERKTFYRHFPVADSIFEACAAHFRAQNPPPDPRPWLEIADPDERLRHGLLEAYGYYRRNERMMANVLRDRELGVPVGEGFHLHRAAMKRVLAEDRPPSARLDAALAVALDFRVWQTLVRAGLDDEQAAELAGALVRAA